MDRPKLQVGGKYGLAVFRGEILLAGITIDHPYANVVEIHIFADDPRLRLEARAVLERARDALFFENAKQFLRGEVLHQIAIHSAPPSAEEEDVSPSPADDDFPF